MKKFQIYKVDAPSDVVCTVSGYCLEVELRSFARKKYDGVHVLSTMLMTLVTPDGIFGIRPDPSNPKVGRKLRAEVFEKAAAYY